MDIELLKEYDYYPEDILMDEPCIMSNKIPVYPFRVKDYKKMDKFASYIALSNEHLNLNNDKPLLENVALYNMLIKANNLGVLENITPEQDKEIFISVISELEELFSLVLRKQIFLNYNYLPEYIFVDDNGEICVHKHNFDELRKIVMFQNIIHEPKIYKDKLLKEWAERVKASRKEEQDDVRFGDIVNFVKVETNTTYEDIKNMNMLQLKADYIGLQKIDQYKTSILFKTVSDKVPNLNYSSEVIAELFKDPNDIKSLFKSTSDSKLGFMYDTSE